MANPEWKKRITESPPDDDCCPICFGAFTFPCRAGCGHWFCGNCILQVWNYTSAAKPCKCPMCSRYITKLTLEASLEQQKEQQVVEVVENVRKYNLLFIGGARGIVQKLLHLPLFIKRIFQDILDPDRHDHCFEIRFFAMTVAAFVIAPAFPSLRRKLVDWADLAAIALVCILRCVGVYRRWRLTQQVRQLAALPPV